MPDMQFAIRFRGARSDSEYETEYIAVGDSRGNQPPGSVWGRNNDKRVWVAEGNTAESYPGNTYILEVRNIPPPHFDSVVSLMNDGITRPESNGDGFVKTHGRSHKFHISELTQNDQDEIADIGFLSLTYGQVNANIRHKASDDSLP